MQRFSNKNTNGRLLIGRETTSNQWGVALFSHLCNHYSLAKEAAIGRQELNAKLHRILWWWFWSWRHICGFAENRRNRRKWTPQGRGNSQKSGDDPIGQVFVYVIAGSNGFERVAVLPIGLVRKATFHYSRFRIFGTFFQIFSSLRTDSFFFQMRVTHRKVDIFRYWEDSLHSWKHFTGDVFLGTWDLSGESCRGQALPWRRGSCGRQRAGGARGRRRWWPASARWPVARTPAPWIGRRSRSPSCRCPITPKVSRRSSIPPIAQSIDKNKTFNPWHWGS